MKIEGLPVGLILSDELIQWLFKKLSEMVSVLFEIGLPHLEQGLLMLLHLSFCVEVVSVGPL